MSLVTDEWRTKTTDMRERWVKFLQSGHLSDCTFSVGVDSEQIKAHRLILAFSSPVFEAMLYGSLAEGSDPIRLPDIEPDTFNDLLRYVYSDKLNLNSVEVAFDLYCAADKYLVPQLMNLCREYLKSQLKPENACKIYEFGKLYNENDLCEESLETVRIETSKVFTHGNITDVKLETLNTIFDQEYLAIKDEIELFKTVEAYVEKNYLSISQSDSNGPSVRSVVQKIRFLTMTATEFSDVVGKSNLLTDSEKLAIILQLTSPKGDFVMLEGFYSHTDSRYLRFVRTFDDERLCMVRNNNTVSEIFSINTSIYIVGIQMSTHNGIPGKLYHEHIIAKLQPFLDGNDGILRGDVLAYCEKKQLVLFNSTQEIIFDEPYLLEKNKKYIISLELCIPGGYLCGKGCLKVEKRNFTIDFNKPKNDFNGYIKSLLCAF